MSHLLPAVVVTFAFAAPAYSQAPPPPYVPPTGPERVEWIVDGSVGVQSLAIGVAVATWNTGWNTPREWGTSWSGFGKRFASREGQMTISNSIEAGLGAAWGEDPRYSRSRGKKFWSRTGHAAKAVFIAHRRDGHLAPAWARYAGAVASNVIANSWLPPSSTTVGGSARRIGIGFGGRFAANLWQEFWPDVRERFTAR